MMELALTCHPSCPWQGDVWPGGWPACAGSGTGGKPGQGRFGTCRCCGAGGSSGGGGSQGQAQQDATGAAAEGAAASTAAAGPEGQAATGRGSGSRVDPVFTPQGRRRLGSRCGCRAGDAGYCYGACGGSGRGNGSRGDPCSRGPAGRRTGSAGKRSGATLPAPS